MTGQILQHYIITEYVASDWQEMRAAMWVETPRYQSCSELNNVFFKISSLILQTWDKTGYGCEK